ncbi:hypothetical protein AC249_AIPGENE10996 [Exaiptasia diaphana]|nr:hypothetical protein AC249_AIPGENE10996 [Exaiptasia diaphana]
MSKNAFGSIQREIKEIQSNSPPCAEGLIRSIDKMVKSHRDKEEKKILEMKLKKAAIHGLDKELQKAMTLNGLELEALPLVREHLTTKTALASFFADTPDGNLTKDMKIVRRKLGETLETQCQSSQFKSIKEQIEKVPSDDHISTATLIREINDMVTDLPNDKEKKALQSSLKRKALWGLSEDLQKLMESRGLAHECLPLVLRHLTTKRDLAVFLYENNKDDDGLQEFETIRRKVGQELEAFGEPETNFESPQFNNSVQDLIKEAPSRSRLERMEVGELKKLDFSPEDANFINEKVRKEGKTAKSKETDEEKREKAEALMDIASNMAAENKKEVGTDVKGKIADLIKNLKNRPNDWNQHEKKSPNEMLNYIKQEQEDMGEVKVADSSSADIKAIVARSSGGLALKGIYYSRWGSTTADLPILKPPCDVCSWNTQSPYETGFRQFSDGNTAAKFSKEVENSGFSHADSVCGFYGGFAAKANVAYGEESSDEQEKSSKTCTTSVSATKFCRCATRCFAIPKEHMELCDQACNMASELCKDISE